MSKELFTIIKSTILFIIAGYIVNKLVFLSNQFKHSATTYNYTIETQFLFFGTLSILILSALVIIKKRSIDYVGMSFLLLTSVKMVISYIFALPIVSSLNTNTVEKTNFYLLFIYFLLIETIIAIRLLNKKEK